MPGEKGEEECSYIFTKTNAGVCLSSFAARSTRKSTATRKSRSKFLENGGGLNWSVQHYLEVYLPEFESPKFVAGVD
jgi:hypothetical protein